MKYLLRILSVACLVFVMSCKDASPESVIQVVSPEEMKSLIDMDDVQFVDVRTEAEHNAEYIEGSQNIDVRSPDFDNDILKLDKNKPVLLYCRSGRRSAQCAEKMQTAGFVKIYDLSGGITKWKFKGYPIKAKS